MQAYLQAGEMTPQQAKDILNCRYLRLSKSNLDHLGDVLAETGEDYLVNESIHFQTLNISD